MRNRKMLPWVTGLGMLWLVGQAQADLRVLFRFDDVGVHVHHVTRLGKQSDFSQVTDADSLSGMPEGMIEVQWLDSNDQLLAVTHVSDPRVTHSPNHTNGFTVSRLGLTTGGWVADGPELARSVIVALPDRSALGLAAETWTLPLRDEN